MKTEVIKKKREIGWRDQIDFIDLGLENVQVKIDTGAKTSVLHCTLIEKLPGRFKKVRFIPLGAEFAGFKNQEFVKSYHEERKIKNSFGNEENRYIIKTTLYILGRKINTEISLRDRSAMEFPVLIGRDTIRKHFVVNVAKTNVSYKRKIKKLKP